MTIERARAHTLPRLWGVEDIRPWSDTHDGNMIGEIWYERLSKEAAESSLLLKLLFTSQPLSIQVHPDDAFAHSIGLPRGKSEAWYVLSATPEAKVALGLTQRLTSQQLREAVDDGTISDLVVWHAVSAGDVIYVPAGTIHAIGAGLVIAELQQRSDATFRLFDHGRQRELHIESAIAVANTGPGDFRVQPKRLNDERTLLISAPHFVFEKIDLPTNSSWHLETDRESWLLVLNGGARIGSFDVILGDAIFVDSDRVNIHTGTIGLVGLVAYTGGGQIPHLLRRLKQSNALDAEWSQEVPLPTSLTRAKTVPTGGLLEATK